MVWPLPVMFVMDVPEIPAASENDVNTELPVTVQVLVASRVRATLVAMPLKVVLFFSVAVSVLAVEATILPVSVSPVAVKVTMLESAASTIFLVLVVKVAPFSTVIIPVSFSTWMASPAVAVREPPFTTRVPVKPEASPDSLW